MKYYSFNKFLREKFGCKVYKIAIDGGFTCPNRDGTIDTRGCIFCSAGGSGDFASDRNLSIYEQIETGKKLVEKKNKSGKYIAYFQAFTNTYAPCSVLKKKFEEAINHPDIVAVSVATRPDCLEDDTFELLCELNKKKPVFVELGLQTIHQKTADYIRRGYDLSVFDNAVKRLKKAGVNIVVHLIFGLPDESFSDMMQSVQYVVDSGVDGVKFQLLHILRGTDLEKEYFLGNVKPLEMDEYLHILYSALKLLPDNMVVHRVTGDGAKKDLIAPLWSADKKRVLNAVNSYGEDDETVS